MAVVLCSCHGTQDEEIVSLKQQCEQAREALKQIQEDYIRQNKELTAIMDELDVLTGRTLSLECNLEGQTNPMTQAEAISRSIATLKVKLEKVEQENVGAASLGGVVKGLKSIIRKQEEEIAELKKKISASREIISIRDSTIREHENVIEHQKSEIDERGRELSLISGKRLQELYEAGEELESLADDSTNILALKGRRNRRNGLLYRASIYEKAIIFYEMASAGGYAPGETRILAVRNKMSELE